MLLEVLWQAKQCCSEIFGIEFVVVIWIAERQACWLAWGNLGLRPATPFFFSFFVFCLLLAQLVSLSFCEILDFCPVRATV